MPTTRAVEVPMMVPAERVSMRFRATTVPPKIPFFPCTTTVPHDITLACSR